MNPKREYNQLLCIDAIDNNITALKTIKKEVIKGYIIQPHLIEYLELSTQRTLKQLLYYIKK